MSIFGRRPQHPLLPARIGDRQAGLITAAGALGMETSDLRQRCANGEVLAEVRGVAFLACDLVAWLDWQTGLWKSKRLFPPALYRGADEVDAEELAGRMEPNPAEKALLRAKSQGAPERKAAGPGAGPRASAQSHR